MDFIKELFDNKLFVTLVYTLAGIILFKIIDLVYRLFHRKKESSIKGSFIKGLFKALVAVFTVIQIASLSNVLSKFANTILMSSSLLVVVIGFVFQEGLSNIVHGTIIALFKPFDIGDRVEVVISGEKISGYIKSMTLRHTVVLSIIDNAESIIPNSLLDNTTVKNLSKQSSSKRYPLTVAITYEDAQTDDKLKIAKRLFSDAVFENKYTVDVRTDKNQDLFIKVDLADSAV
ncbi:MAG: mechanosensitive ion channel family protein, partial [Lachnospiraceae bacterium]|nr:mechanosensitive ion channel family protein [Lachnospiraceae bacterium]